MIDRYDLKEISSIWSLENKYKTYLQAELALLKALEKETIPKGSFDLFEKTQINIDRINEIEKITRHDVIAFCTSITEQVSHENSKYFHFGCTSSDIIDTATNLQIKQSLKLILNQYESLLKTLKNKAIENKNVLCLGRSHGMSAEPMSFGIKFLSSYAEFKRSFDQLESYYQNDITGQFSGAVGNYTILSTQVEKDACDILNLKVEDVSTQIIPRDRITKLILIISQIASAIERMSTEIRLLHHSDIGEVYEGFSKGQKGSSTMPHKKNPISAENLSGLARVMKSHVLIALENNNMWHERDISHSSSERMMLPDNLGLCFYAVKRLTSTIENLVINTKHIENKALSSPKTLSSFLLHKIIKESNFSREEIYPIVQEITFKSNSSQELVDNFKLNEKLKNIDFSMVENIDLTSLKKIFLREVDLIYNRLIS